MADVPPNGSPQPPRLVTPPPELLPHPDPKHDTGLNPVLRGQFQGTKWLTRFNAAGLLALLAAVGVTSDKVKGWLVRDAVAQDAGVAEIRHDVEVLKKQQKQFFDLVDELAKDNRALYRTIRTGEAQPRLEKPLELDGGR